MKRGEQRQRSFENVRYRFLTFYKSDHRVHNYLVSNNNIIQPRQCQPQLAFICRRNLVTSWRESGTIHCSRPQVVLQTAADDDSVWTTNVMRRSHDTHTTLHWTRGQVKGSATWQWSFNGVIHPHLAIVMKQVRPTCQSKRTCVCVCVCVCMCVCGRARAYAYVSGYYRMCIIACVCLWRKGRWVGA